MTAKQQHVLEVLKEWFRTWSVPPTLEQLAKASGYTSPNSAWRHVVALRDLGMITFEPKKKQSIALVHAKVCETCGQPIYKTPRP